METNKSNYLPVAGDKMKNGAIVIMAKKGERYHPEDRHLFTVLCKSGNDYVTWLANSIDMSCCWGHYFKDEASAVKDYSNRK